ncbi:transposase family protein [Streptomyces olivochromogenes]
MTLKWARAALSHPAFTGISRAHLADLIEELAGSWTASCESALHHRRGRKRKRQAGAGPKHELLFTDRVVVTLVHLRLQLPHAALAELYGMEHSTITRAIGEIRPCWPSEASPTDRAAPCGPEPTGPAACTTRPRCAPRASPSSSASAQV